MSRGMCFFYCPRWLDVPVDVDMKTVGLEQRMALVT